MTSSLAERAKRREDRLAAQDIVIRVIAQQAADCAARVRMHERGSAGDAYRREIARLWKVALLAVRASV